jgi:hypothetical protein
MAVTWLSEYHGAALPEPPPARQDERVLILAGMHVQRCGHAARDYGVFHQGESALRRPAIENKPRADHAEAARGGECPPYDGIAQTDVARALLWPGYRGR